MHIEHPTISPKNSDLLSIKSLAGENIELCVSRHVIPDEARIKKIRFKKSTINGPHNGFVFAA